MPRSPKRIWIGPHVRTDEESDELYIALGEVKVPKCIDEDQAEELVLEIADQVEEIIEDHLLPALHPLERAEHALFEEPAKRRISRDESSEEC